MPSTTSVSTKATTLHAFFNGASTPGPALFVPGARRSSRVSKPSKQILDVNNAEPQAKSSEAFEALQLLKSAYCNGHLAADKDAHKHSLSDMDTYS